MQRLIMRPSASSRSRLNGLGGMREDTDSHNDEYGGMARAMV